jgi:hypothetical protein
MTSSFATPDTGTTCTQCGAPVTVPNRKGLCVECRLAQQSPEWAKKRKEAEERRKLMAELGMPPDAPWQRITVPGDAFGPRWAKYTLELFGMLVPDAPEPIPFAYFRIGTPGGGLLVQLWQQVVRHQDTQLWGEKRWHPDRGFSVAIRGLENKHTMHEIILIRRGLGLLMRPSRTGRPPGTGFFPDKESFLAVFGRAAKEVHACGRNPTMRNVLMHVRTSFGDVDKALLSRWVRKLGWATWSDFLAEIGILVN